MGKKKIKKVKGFFEMYWACHHALYQADKYFKTRSGRFNIVTVFKYGYQNKPGVIKLSITKKQFEEFKELSLRMNIERVSYMIANNDTKGSTLDELKKRMDNTKQLKDIVRQRELIQDFMKEEFVSAKYNG